jgi:molybdopterin-guanine dinucleotide biosynthesis protein A
MGQPKAWLPLEGETMLHRAVRVIRGVINPVVVVAAPGQEVPVLPAGVRVVHDDVEGRGPLGGLAAGLHALTGECEAAYLSGCDVPLLQAEFVRAVSALAEGTQLTVPLIAGRLHPLAAVYSLDVLPVVLAQLAAGDLRMTRLTELVPTRFLTEADFATVDAELESLQNVNTPEEYENVLRTLRMRRTLIPSAPAEAPSG